MMSRPLPCGMPSTMSMRTTSASSLSASRWARVAPTFPAPTTVTFLFMISSDSTLRPGPRSCGPPARPAPRSRWRGSRSATRSRPAPRRPRRRGGDASDTGASPGVSVKRASAPPRTRTSTVGSGRGAGGGDAISSVTSYDARRRRDEPQLRAVARPAAVVERVEEIAHGAVVAARELDRRAPRRPAARARPSPAGARDRRSNEASFASATARAASSARPASDQEPGQHGARDPLVLDQRLAAAGRPRALPHRRPPAASHRPAVNHGRAERGAAAVGAAASAACSPLTSPRASAAAPGAKAPPRFQRPPRRGRCTAGRRARRRPRPPAAPTRAARERCVRTAASPPAAPAITNGMSGLRYRISLWKKTRIIRR